jgi:Fe-S oxidoreductase
VDVARFKSEFLADYWSRHGLSRHARAMSEAHDLARIGSRFAPLSNWIANAPLVRRLNEHVLGVDRRRRLPAFVRTPLAERVAPVTEPDAVLFTDTFTNYYDPEIGLAAIAVLNAASVRVGLAGNVCCGRPKISKGVLADAKALAAENVRRLYPHVAAGRQVIFCEPSCLSAVREDAPDLLRGEAQRRARTVAAGCVLFEQIADRLAPRLGFTSGPPAVLLHGHCHQKAMGLLAPARALLSRLPGTTVIDLNAGCCGMAGSFGYAREHFEVSHAIAEQRLLPAIRQKTPGTIVVAAGTSCRHQVLDFAGETAVHPAVLMAAHLDRRR